MTKNRQARRKAAALAKGRASQGASRQARQTPSLSRARQAARALDGYAGFRDALAQIADERGHWAGLPTPIDGQQLIIEPTFPHAEAFARMGVSAEEIADESAAEAEGWTFRNRWYSRRLRCDILIYAKGRKIAPVLRNQHHHLDQLVQTIGCVPAWGLEQEHNALNLLGTMIRHHQMRQYVLTGMFLEKSDRSGITYIFRRLRPTIALAPDRSGESMRILAALCQHPIGYYAGSYGGVMVPTDDVIAHLAMMRGDEHLFWKRSNQHPAYRAEAGI